VRDSPFERSSIAKYDPFSNDGAAAAAARASFRGIGGRGRILDPTFTSGCGVGMQIVVSGGATNDMACWETVERKWEMDERKCRSGLPWP
jgi:hypothetical protein